MSSDEENKLKVIFILDVIGKPPEHLVKALNRVIEEIDKEKGAVVKSKNIKKPTSLKDSPNFYTTFAEVDIEFENIEFLMISAFKYMPAHIEISEPELIGLSNNGLNDILNELVRRLHGYDEIARAMQLENKKLREKIMQVTGEPVITPMTPKSELTEKQRRELEQKGKKAKSKKAKKTKQKTSKKSAKKKSKKSSKKKTKK